MQRMKWTERVFNFDIPPAWMPNILERLRGTPVRIRQIITSISHEALTRKSGNHWSIQEHIGHLTDLEELHEGRIDDFISRKPVLRAADMSNTKTTLADYNSKRIEELVKLFSGSRMQFIRRLEELDDETQLFHSLHPRLKVLIRPVDMAFFTAEHDDHHLATIRQLL